MIQPETRQRLFVTARPVVVATMKPQILEQGKLPLDAVLMTEPSDFPDALLGVNHNAIRTHTKENRAVRHLEQSGNGTQKRRFPGAVRAMQRKRFARGNGNADVRLEQTSASCQRQV